MVLKNFKSTTFKKVVMFFMAVMVLTFALIGCKPKEPEVIEVESVTVSETTVDLLVGASQNVTATVLPADATDKAVTWMSSDNDVATVSNGRITAVGSGTATITATASGKSATVTVTVTAITYTFTFNVNGGNSIANQTIESGKKAARPTDPTKVGATFDGWYADNKFVTVYSFDNPVTDNTTVYAKWAPIMFDVTFDVDGGEEIDAVEIEYNQMVTKPADPVKAGHTFINWYKDSEFSTPFDFAIERITADVTIYAKFEIDEYTITFDSNGGSPVAAQVITYNLLATEPADPEKSGFVFGGWFVGSVEFNFTTPIVEDVTLVAKWDEDPNFKVVNFNLNNGEWDIHATDEFISSAPIKSTAVGAFNATNPQYLAVYQTNIFIDNANRKFTPSKWVHRVGVNLNDKGFYEVAEKFMAGADTTAEQLAAFDYVIYAHDGYPAGYAFVGSLEAGQIITFTGFDFAEATDYIVSGLLNVYAADPALSTTSALLETGSTLPTPKLANHKFVGWYSNAELTGDPVTTVTANATVYAKWEADEVAIKFVTNGGGELEDAKVLYGQKLTEPADPVKTGYTFLGWFKEAAFTTAYDFNEVVTGPFTLYAKWEALEYDVTYVTNGAPEIATHKVAHDAKITMPQQPVKEGFVFGGWYLEATFENLYDFDTVVTGAVTLHAKWDAKKAVVIDYRSVYNSTLKAYYIQVTVTGELLDAASIKSIKNTRVAGEFVDAVVLTPDTDTVLWFKVAAENANPNLKAAGIYTYEVVKQDDSTYAFEVNYDPALVTDLPYEVKFVVNEGSEVPSQIIVKDNKATRPADPTRLGYTFVGWYKEAAFTTEFDFDAPITAITSIYAKWSLNTYSITYNVNDGVIRYDSIDAMFIDFLTDLHTFTKSTDTLQVFMHGVDKTSGYAGTWADLMVDASPVLYQGARPTEVNNDFFASSEAYMEKWLPFFDLIQDYVIAVNPAQNFWGDLFVGHIRIKNFVQNTRPAYSSWAPKGWIKVSEYNVTSATFELPVPVKENKVFMGWYDNAEFNGNIISQIEKGTAGNLVLYAKYVDTLYEVTFESNEGSVVPVAKVEGGTKVVQPADPTREGFRFIAWFTDSELTTEFDFNTVVSSNLTLYAKWGSLAPESVSIVGADVISVGQTATYTATTNPETSDQTVVWSVSDELVATISEEGVLTAVGYGTVTVTATSVNPEVKAEKVVTVYATPTGVSYRGAEEFVVGGKGAVYGQVYAASGEVADQFALSYSVDNAAVLTIDPDTGLVTALSTGSAVITITSTVDPTKKATKTVNVRATDYVFTGFTNIIVTKEYEANESFYSSVDYKTHIMGYTAFATLEAALQAAKAGDSIVFLDGTYDENVTINKNNITLKGDATLKGVITVATAVDGLTIDGLTFTGKASIVGEQAAAIKNFTFKNNHVYDTTAVEAVLMFKTATATPNENFVITGNVFELVERTVHEVRYVQLNNHVNLTIKNNYFEGVPGIEASSLNYADAIRVNGTANGTTGPGLGGVVEITDNEFVNIGQRSIWIRRYNASVIKINNNIVNYSGDQKYGGGFQLETWSGTTQTEIEIMYNTFTNIKATFAVRMNNTAVTALNPWSANVNYNKFINNVGLTYYVQGFSAEKLINVENNFYSEEPAAAKFTNTTGFEEFFTNPAEFELALILEKADPVLGVKVFEEDLEAHANIAYADVTTSLGGLNWNIKETYLNPDASDKTSATALQGAKMIRMRGANVAYMELAEFFNGIATLTFDAKYYSSSHATSVMTVSKQVEGGEWVKVADITLTDSYVTQTVNINEAGKVKVRIDVTTKSANIDNIRFYKSTEMISEGFFEAYNKENLAAYKLQVAALAEGLTAKYTSGSLDSLLANHGFSGMTLTYGTNIFLVGYKAYIPLRAMATEETILPWQAVQPYNTTDAAAISNFGLNINGPVAAGATPNGTGAVYHNVNETSVVVNSKELYGYQSTSAWGNGQYGMMRIDKNGLVKDNYIAADLTAGIQITLEAGDYLVTCFQADKAAMGSSILANTQFAVGQTVTIMYNQALAYKG